MKVPRYDLIIEAVHYAGRGRIGYVRAYERRGRIFSDVILIDRQTLAKRLQEGRSASAGKRQPLCGGTFTTGHRLRLDGGSAGAILVEGCSGSRDDLAGLPVL